MIVLLFVGLGLLVNRLSSVLLPFFIAWLLAYLMYPLVTFLQYKCRLRSRTLSIIVAALIVLAVITGLLLLIIPPIVSEFSKASAIFSKYADRILGGTGVHIHT